ncbi:MAG: TVP38/TMEM64 family protein [Clostridiaceae bacterium]|nr:TVP38/TMEM64 family protein [Clostridiaceae bacterium]
MVMNQSDMECKMRPTKKQRNERREKARQQAIQTREEQSLRKIVPATELYARHRQILFQRTIAILFMVLMVLGSIAAYVLWGEEIVEFIANPARVRAMVDEHPVMSRFIFVALTFIQVVIAIIPGEPFEIAAGYAFGFWEGTFLCIVASYLASVLIFFLVRRFGRPILELFFEPEQIDDIRIFNNAKSASFLMVIIFLIPGTPKDIMTYFAGLTSMNLSTWLLVLLARIPSIVSSTAGGGLLGSERYMPALIVLAVTALLAVIGIYIYKKMSQRAKDEDGESD